MKNFSDDEIAYLEKGKFDICVKVTDKKTEHTPEISKSFDLKKINFKLEELTYRKDSSYLLSLDLTVAELGKIAKSIDIPFRKGEKKEQFVERIVEKTVGFKLNSEAVRGNHLDVKP